MSKLWSRCLLWGQRVLRDGGVLTLGLVMGTETSGWIQDLR